MQYYPHPYVQYSPYPAYPPYGYLTPNGAQSGWPASVAVTPTALPHPYPMYTPYSTPYASLPAQWPTNAHQPNYPNSAASYHTPLPSTFRTPRPIQFDIPDEGTLTWQPHPQPHPTIPAQTWWAPIVGMPVPAPPALTPGQALALSGGWPYPGQGPKDFISGDTWPPKRRLLDLHVAPWLIPNPVNADSFTLRWDIRFDPRKSLHITGRAFFRSAEKSLNVVATHPPTKEMVIMPQPQWGGSRWGPIYIQQSKNISCMDVLMAVYDYYRMPISETEMHELTRGDRHAYEVIHTSMFERCCLEDDLFEYARQRGMNRADAMGGTTMFWGM